MDQLKIGKFIAARRKEQGLTQSELAERLGVTDRAVSKWENGRSMPDSSIMLDLCKELSISVNDLLNGEIIMDFHQEKTEQLLLDLAKQKEQADKRLLTIEIVLGVLSTIVVVGGVLAAGLLQIEDWQRYCLIAVSCLIGFPGIFISLWIEQVAGYYRCEKCGHCYVPTYKAMLMAQHMGRTRKMRCPQCRQKSWQKKVIKK